MLTKIKKVHNVRSLIVLKSALVSHIELLNNTENNKSAIQNLFCDRQRVLIVLHIQDYSSENRLRKKNLSFRPSLEANKSLVELF